MQLKNYLPPLFFAKEEFEEIIKAQQIELDNYNSKIEDLIKQCFVNTATWGLKYWEEFLGIKIDLNKDVEFRRSTIIAKLRGQGTVTKSMIKNVSESFSNGEVDIIENNKEHSFIVKFIGSRGIPPNLGDLKNAIEEIKPCHLKALFEFVYNTWSEFSSFTWEKANSLTWQEMNDKKI